jgi:penicillin-insensitive murein endopeptidase
MLRKLSLLTSALLVFTQVNASEAIGFYSDGKLKNSENIYNNSNFIKLFEKRGKSFTTTEMLGELNKLSDVIKRMYPAAERLQVGDLSAQNGGKIHRHVSHQNGLDADIVYLRHNGYEQPSSAPEWEEYFVKSGKPTGNFHKVRNWFMFDYLVHNTDVNRIFVDKAIKSYYCKEKLNKKKYSADQIKRNIKVLKHMRPAKYHITHLHLRLKCPAGDNRCKNQAAVPKGSGCNSLNVINQNVN